MVGFNRAVVEIRRPFVPQGWREVHWAKKSEIIDDITISQEKFCCRGRKNTLLSKKQTKV